MKPIDLNVYDREYKNDYGAYFRFYTFEQCKPMRAVSQKRSEAQKKATQKMVEDYVIVLDTETTGLNCPYIVDIAAIFSRTGETIVNTKRFTKHSIESGLFTGCKWEGDAHGALDDYEGSIKHFEEHCQFKLYPELRTGNTRAGRKDQKLVKNRL